MAVPGITLVPGYASNDLTMDEAISLLKRTQKALVSVEVSDPEEPLLKLTTGILKRLRMDIQMALENRRNGNETL